MEKSYKNCQSCGMPMKKDEAGGGTNADNTKSIMFCSHCYQDGKFTKPDLDVNQMKTLVKVKLVEMGFPKFLGGFFTMNIPKLERWKQS